VSFPTPAPAQTVDLTQLTKYIKQFLELNPVTNFQALNVDTLTVKDLLVVADQAKFAKSQDWRFFGSQGQPVYEHGWVNFGAPYANGAFVMTPDGFVQGHGMIKSGTLGSSALTFPPGFRPAAAHEFIVFSNGTAGRVTVLTDGTLTPVSPSSNLSVSLDQIRFKAA
jgi:hypothetical protein